MGRITRASVGFKYLPVVLTVAIGVFFSSVLFEVVQREERTKMQLAFDRQAETRIAAIGRGMEHSIEILLSIKGLYESSQSVTRAEFKSFVASSLSRDRHIQALEWIPRVPKERREEYELAARAEGYPNFEIRELDNSGKMVTAARRQEYFPVYYVEPYLGNERALGLDLVSSTTRWQSLLEARNTGETTATSRIKLVQERRTQYGVLIFHPIYEKKAEINRLEQRIKHLMGFGLAVLRIGDMVENLLANHSPECIDIYIYDRSAIEGEQFLHFHPSKCQSNKNVREKEAINKLKRLENFEGFYYQKVIKFGRREWLFLCTANSEYMLINKSARSREILVAGLLLTSILAGYFWQSIKGREKIEALVKERTVELSQTNGELSAAAIELEKTRDEALEHLRRETAISLENQRLSEALQGSNQALQDSINDLKKAQLQLVQSEKMSALGNLVAGVAHEINNPVGFISGNLYQAQQSIQDLIAHLNLYLAEADRQEIASHAELIELDYLLADLPKMISSMDLGCDRIKNISTSLRTFSRTDNEDPVDFNLHEGIESTLLILKHRLKGNSGRPGIEIVKDYGDLPKVSCFPGQLNQVFMNLLANAIDALEESNSGRRLEDITANPNRITIKTAREGDRVVVRIVDNGTGMPPEVKERIFEQGFTTKRVGKGTGLGMAIARQIVVEKHGGSITCNSQWGKGTEFAIALPLT